MSELPGDMVEEILCRVPAKSLKRLRSTCKRWNHLFNDRRFALKHLDKAVRESMVLMLAKELKVCSINVNLHGVSSIDVTGTLSLIHSHSRLSQTHIYEVLHCDGLLLCRIRDGTGSIIVWNPCTGQTKWIQPSHSYKIGYNTFALGCYQDTKSGNNNGYKILSYHNDYIDKQEVAIYEIRSNLWRVLDVTLDFKFVHTNYRVSLKGKTYWFAVDREKIHLGIFLLWFDYTTERFGRMPFPCHHPINSCGTMVLSVVREEKLAVLLQGANTSRTEVWMTNKVDETKVVSWSMVLAIDHLEFVNVFRVSILVDEEKKFFVFCDHNSIVKDGKIHDKNVVHIIEEDNKVTKVDFAVASTLGLNWPHLFNYVPSLVQIH